MKRLFFLFTLLGVVVALISCAEGEKPRAKEAVDGPASIQITLDNTRPLTHPRGNRLPLYLWPASNVGRMPDAQLETLLKDLDARGIGLFTSWRKSEEMDTYLAVARMQHKLGLKVNVDATTPMYSFYDGTDATAHCDSLGNPFFDNSFGGVKMGCPFTLHARKDTIKQRIEHYVGAYRRADVPIDFIFSDWEVDGPIEVNKAYENSCRCARCKEHLGTTFGFEAFREGVRSLRSYLQHYAYSSPLLRAFPHSLVGNYAVYPNDGYRYWYDYFEHLEPCQPHITDQRATYRTWPNDFPATGYTCAMPVVYPWDNIWYWYAYENSDYRWFYNMLLEASNAGKSTPAFVPIISFVHWNTVFVRTGEADPEVKPMSREAYKELLWHMLLRGTDTFFMWCMESEYASEVAPVQEVYAEAQQYGDFLERGVPVTFEVPRSPGVVLSGLALDDNVLVRRTDFSNDHRPARLMAGTKTLTVDHRPGQCVVLSLK